VLTGLLAGALALGLLVGAYTLYSRHEAGRMDAELTSYVVQSPSSVRITFSVVTRGHDGECKVRARSRDGNEAGSQIVAVTSNGKREQVVTVDLTTRAQPVNGELVGCHRLHPKSP
jgi:hypothetical protein